MAKRDKMLEHYSKNQVNWLSKVKKGILALLSGCIVTIREDRNRYWSLV